MNAKMQFFAVKKAVITKNDYVGDSMHRDFRTIDIEVTDEDGSITIISLFVDPGFVPEFKVESE